jgi:cell division transport system permease protein
VLNIVKNQPDAIKIRPIIDRLRTYPEVDEVNYQGRLINRIESYYQKFVKGMTGLLILVLLISVLIISNTVRLTIFAKEELIKALQLIGATRAFVKAPFVIEGVFHGLIGALLASILLICGLSLGEGILQSVTGLKLQYDTLFLISVLCGTGILISLVGSSRAISKYLK